MTPHLWRLVELRVLGFSYIEIAEKMKTSPKTVGVQFTKIYNELDVDNVALLIAKATLLGHSPYLVKVTHSQQFAHLTN